MAIDFPSTPATGDVYTFNGRSYRYNGSGWDRIGTAAIGSDTDPGVFESATQAEMEAASATNVVVTPGRMQYHPGMAKAWANYAITASVPTIAASHNVSSLTDNGTGDVTANWTVSFSSANYSFVAIFDSVTGASYTGSTLAVQIHTLATGSIRHATVLAGAVSDSAPFVSFCVHGDQ